MDMMDYPYIIRLSYEKKVLLIFRTSFLSIFENIILIFAQARTAILIFSFCFNLPTVADSEYSS